MAGGKIRDQFKHLSGVVAVDAPLHGIRSGPIQSIGVRLRHHASLGVRILIPLPLDRFLCSSCVGGSMGYAASSSRQGWRVRSIASVIRSILWPVATSAVARRCFCPAITRS